MVLANNWKCVIEMVTEVMMVLHLSSSQPFMALKHV